METYASTVEHDLNHKPRPCLNGKNACQVYFTNKRTFSKRERRDAYDWITNLQNDILCSAGGSAASGLAYRSRGLAEHERLYYHYNQWKSVTQFFLISVS
jgi:hypothetical protein